MFNTLFGRTRLTFRDQAHATAQVLCEDLSAACQAGGHLWLGGDEANSVERLSYSTADTWAEHQSFLLRDFVDLLDPEEEVDIEGLAYAAPYLWVVGSHSTKRKRYKSKKKEAENLQRLATVKSEPSRCLLARIPLVNGQLLKSCQHPDHADETLTAALVKQTPDGNCLIQALKADPHLGPFITAGIPSKDNGLDIEGIAVQNNRVFLGLRGPVLRGWAIILELAIQTEQTMNGDRLRLTPIGSEGGIYRKQFVNLRGLGIRDLHFDGQDLLILAGPTMDLDGSIQLYRLSGKALKEEAGFSVPDLLCDIPHGVGQDRAEGITLLSHGLDGAAPTVGPHKSLLVVYDSPTAARLQSGTEGKVVTHSVVADIFALEP